MKVITLLALTTPFCLNISMAAITELNIHNNLVVPISYAVNSSRKESIQQFSYIQSWIETNELTTNNSCVFIKTNPNCRLDNFYNKVIVYSKKDLNTNNNISLKFINSKGVVQKPINLNLYMRYRNLSLLGWFIDVISWIVLVILFLIAVQYNILKKKYNKKVKL